MLATYFLDTTTCIQIHVVNSVACQNQNQLRVQIKRSVYKWHLKMNLSTAMKKKIGSDSFYKMGQAMDTT